MKKLLSLFILFLFCCPTYGAVQPPQWDEFCPNQYLNVQYQQDTTMPRWANNLLAISLVGLPIAAIDTNKYNKIKTNNYWYQRRIEFQNSLSACQNMTDNEKTYSYLRIAQKQYDENNRLKLEEIQRAAEQARSAARSNHSSGPVYMQPNGAGGYYGYHY